MIGKMTRYDFILLSGESEDFLKEIQQLGVVDITRSEKSVDDKSAAMIEAIEAGRSKMSWLESRDWTKDAAYSSIGTRLDEAVAESERRKPWGRFDPQTIKAIEEGGRKLRFYVTSRKKFDPAWAELQPLEIIHEGKEKVWFVTIGNDKDYAFPIADIPAPQASFEESDTEIASLQEALAKRSKELEKEREDLERMEKDSRSAIADLDRYLAKATGTSAAENHITVFTGFAPVEEESRLKEAFDGMDCYWTSQRAKAEDRPPINFRNNRFVKMFEPLTDMYGRPSYDGFDPTPFISIFFLLFFAMCMGDAGYGIILIIVGLLLGKAKSFASFSPLVVTLGLGTLVVGTLFHTFFSMDMATWSFIPDWLKKVMVPSKVAGYDGTMILALIIGIVHLCLAMIVKTVTYTRSQGFLESLGTWGWTLLVVGGVTLAMVALTGMIDAKLTKILIIVLGVISAVCIFPLNNIHRNPLINVGSGLWDAYNMATGILGDVLSYLRLYALGLAGSMLGFAFNDLAKMAMGDGGAAGWVAFILIVIVGHTLNLAMAALGAFVHPLRLNFLEFFKNSGYEATGKKYKPLENK